MAGDSGKRIWTRNELVIVLGLYKKYAHGKLSRKNPKEEWEPYSELVRSIAKKRGVCFDEGTRLMNKGGVEAKYKSFKSLHLNDPKKSWAKTLSVRIHDGWDEFKSEFTPDKIDRKGRLEKEVERIIASSGYKFER